MNKIFKTGDRVTTPSVPETMTVDYLTKNGNYNCKWHEGNTLKEADFKPELLKLKHKSNS